MRRIEAFEKIHSMSDLYAVIDEYMYNGLLSNVDLDLSKATIED